MNTKRIHYYSGLIIAIFVGIHLLNHLASLFGAAYHIELMDQLRKYYRNFFVELLLLAAVFVQISSGFQLFKARWKTAGFNFEGLQVWSGFYLAIFFIIHLSTVLGGRIFLQLDTNFYFGVAGVNTFPFNLFFVPYYGLAVLAFFGHIAAIHHQKMKRSFFGLSPRKQAVGILVLGFVFTFALFAGLTDYFKGVEIPAAYHVLIGK